MEFLIECNIIACIEHCSIISCQYIVTTQLAYNGNEWFKVKRVNTYIIAWLYITGNMQCVNDKQMK